MQEYSIKEVRDRLKSAVDSRSEALEELGFVIRIMKMLRASGGCPWDRKQTHQSLLKNLLEEAYEFVDTVNRGSNDDMREELGDLFMQVVFHAELASERGAFDIEDVAHDLADKLIRRHRHVFGQVKAANSAEALSAWNNAKADEYDTESLLDGVPKSMPALLRARKVQERASRVGFDWAEASGAMAKLDEELGEFKLAVESGDKVKSGEELGDLLFAVCNVARFVGECPEVALTAAVDKFQRRFKHVEKRLSEQNRKPEDSTLEEMDRYWDEAKALE